MKPGTRSAHFNRSLDMSDMSDVADTVTPASLWRMHASEFDMEAVMTVVDSLVTVDSDGDVGERPAGNFGFPDMSDVQDTVAEQPSLALKTVIAAGLPVGEVSSKTSDTLNCFQEAVLELN